MEKQQGIKSEGDAETYRKMICKIVYKIGNESMLRKIYAVAHSFFLHEDGV